MVWQLLAVDPVYAITANDSLVIDATRQQRGLIADLQSRALMHQSMPRLPRSNSRMISCFDKSIAMRLRKHFSLSGIDASGPVAMYRQSTSIRRKDSFSKFVDPIGHRVASIAADPVRWLPLLTDHEATRSLARAK